MADNNVNVYGLRAGAGDIRYVGITRQPLSRRLAQHWYGVRAGEKTHKATWMRKCHADGCAVEIVLLEVVPECDWQSAERRHIALYPNLTNGTAGGDGVSNPTPLTRARLREAQLGKSHPPEVVAKRAASMRGNKNALGHKQTPEHVSKALAGRLGKVGVYPRTDEHRKQISEANLGNTKRRGATHSAEARERMRAAKLGTKRGPHSEETRRRISEGRQRALMAARAAQG